MQHARFHTLDALRGIAAIAVVLFHAGDYSPIPAPGGYLAADLFFVLSGFVLAHAYEARLAAGMSLMSFVRARLTRIYPVFWIGALLGSVLLGGSPLTMFMIPTVTEGGLLFDANWPLWSLLFELIANIVWAALLVRLEIRKLAVIVALLGAALIPAILAYGLSDLGAFWLTVVPGLVRTFYSFILGAVLFRLWERSDAKQHLTWLGWALLPLLGLLLCYAPADRALFDIVMLGGVIPLIVWLGAHWAVPAPRLAKWLGGLSFPLYCMHAPLVAFAHASPPVMVLLLIGMIAIASAVDRFFDQPIQSKLKARRQAACPNRKALV
jgi:peptidoglycan/LPS O-acetylase OafA/YrhL